jgi:hypothetical protein
VYLAHCQWEFTAQIYNARKIKSMSNVMFEVSTAASTSMVVLMIWVVMPRGLRMDSSVSGKHNASASSAQNGGSVFL